MDPNEFRLALGAFATGVTIITTRAPDGAPCGLTVNSFNSVSLNPPLVLFSLAKNALSLPAFRDAKHWAVHVLAADQEQLSTRFARRGADKFEGVTQQEGLGAVPLLTGCAARFQCSAAFQYEGGDHVIFVGRVEAFDRTDAPPLVFHAGNYAHAARRDPDEARVATNEVAGSFDEDFLGYLLGRGHFRFYSRIRPHLAQLGLSDEEFSLLSRLTLRGLLRAPELEGMQSVLGSRTAAAMDSLVQRGFVHQARDEYDLTESGRATSLRLISAAKAAESQLIEELGAGESSALKTLLRRLLRVLAR